MKNSQATARQRFVRLRSLAGLTYQDWNRSGVRNAEPAAKIENWWLSHRSRPREEWLFESLVKADARRKRFIVRDLAMVTTPGLEAVLADFLNSGDQMIEKEAFAALWTNFRSSYAVEHARKALQSEDWELAARYLRLVADLAVTPLFPEVASLAKQTSPASPLAAPIADAAGTVDLTEARHTLLTWDALPGEDYPAKAVIRALAKIDGDAYADRLLEHLKEGNPEQRRAAAYALATTGSAQG